MKHVIVDSEGRPTAFYDDAIHSAIPVGAQPIADAAYEALLVDVTRRALVGEAVVDVGPRAPTVDERAAMLRGRRDVELARSDIDVLRFIEAGRVVPAPLRTYRQALRDLPSADGFPAVDLPARPAVALP